MSSTAADYVFSVRRRAVSEPVQPILQQGMRAGDVHLKETAAIAARIGFPGETHSPVFLQINRAISAAPPAISLQSSHKK